MIEIRAAFHYLCIDNCSEDDWECRWNILNLHDCATRKRMFEAQGNIEEANGFEAQAEELRDRLRANPSFQQVRNQRQLLHGQTPYLMPIEEMIEKTGLEKKTYRWLHILFSSHVHGLPMSYFRMAGPAGDGRGRGMPTATEEGYTSLCLSLATTLLAGARDEVQALFGGVGTTNISPAGTQL